MHVTTEHRIINGDCREMDSIADKSISLIITSPPYWQLKDYGAKSQIGFDDDYETYINNLNIVWQECFRVLQNGCRLCINIGDQFARSVYYGRYKVIPIHSEIIRFCEVLGLDFMGKIIWQKTTTMNTTGGGAVMGSYPFPRNGIIKIDYEYILIFKKQGLAPKPTQQQKELSKMTNEQWNEYFSGHWNFPGVKQDKHLAMFPDELPRRLIRMFSFVNETVLDPFAGSGTTAKAARQLGRNSVSYEINKDYIPLIKSKIGADSLLETVSIIESNSQSKTLDINKMHSKLPYLFVDSHKLDKKIDIKTKQYGSKIDNAAESTALELYSVEKVISPSLIKLNNNKIVHLIGIKQDESKLESALCYLKEKLHNRKVYLRKEDVPYSDGHMSAYLYLDNKTFINAHLLKNGYALVDESVSFTYLQKFISIRENA